MTRKLIDLFPRDPRIDAARTVERDARNLRIEVVKEVQAQCAHVDVGKAYISYASPSVVCLMCGFFETPETPWNERILERRRDVFEIGTEDFYARRLFTDR